MRVRTLGEDGGRRAGRPTTVASWPSTIACASTASLPSSRSCRPTCPSRSRRPTWLTRSDGRDSLPSAWRIAWPEPARSSRSARQATRSSTRPDALTDRTDVLSCRGPCASSTGKSPCKTALNRVKGMPFHWSLNPYMGCAHRCTFCYVRAFERMADRPSDDRYGTSIRVKTNLVEVLRRELARPRWTRETVAIGAATDLSAS